MRNRLFRFRDNEAREVNALALDTHDMVRQLAFSLVPERRVKGALHTVSRDTGISYSKLRKLYYKLTDHVLAVEWMAIRNAHSAWLLKQEQKLEQEIEHLRALRATRMQGRLDLGDTANVAGLMATSLDLDTDKV